MTSQLVEQSTRHQVFLERVKTGEANQFVSFLRRIDDVIKRRLSGDITELSRSKLERLLKSVDGAIEKIYDDYWDELSGNLIDVGEYEAEFESRSLDNVLVNFETSIPSVEQVRASIFSAPLSVRGADGGKLLEPFIKDWTSIEAKRVTGAIRQGFFEGQTNAQIMRTIRGTKANGYRDGLLAVSKRGADAVVKTAVQHAASVARQGTWDANSNVVVGVEWVSTLDSRTTQVCRSLDGQVFPINSGPRPPIHIRCRSTTSAKLDARFDMFKQGQTRSSKGGPVSSNETYYSWLKKQSAAFQNEAIGANRATLLRKGGLSAQRFAELNIGKKLEPLTLKEMRRLEPLAFERAKI